MNKPIKIHVSPQSCYDKNKKTLLLNFGDQFNKQPIVPFLSFVHPGFVEFCCKKQ